MSKKSRGTSRASPHPLTRILCNSSVSRPVKGIWQLLRGAARHVKTRETSRDPAANSCLPALIIFSINGQLPSSSGIQSWSIVITGVSRWETPLSNYCKHFIGQHQQILQPFHQNSWEKPGLLSPSHAGAHPWSHNEQTAWTTTKHYFPPWLEIFIHH